MAERDVEFVSRYLFKCLAAKLTHSEQAQFDFLSPGDSQSAVLVCCQPIWLEQLFCSCAEIFNFFSHG